MTDNDDYTLYGQNFCINNIEELENIRLSRVDIFNIVNDFNHANNHYSDFRDVKYFKKLCDKSINTINIEIERIDRFEEQYIKCYTSDITPVKQSIIMMAGGLNKIQLNPEALAEYKKLFIDLYDTAECFNAGLQPIAPSIWNFLTVCKHCPCPFFSIDITDNIDDWNNIEYIRNEIEHNKHNLIKQRLLYEQLKELAYKVA